MTVIDEEDRYGAATPQTRVVMARKVFPANPRSVSRARRFVAKALTGHPAAAIVALLVSELATNAVVHARSRFEITVRLALGRIRVEVSDGSPWLPRPRQSWATADRENGRGLHLVERLSSQWGATATTDGKVVWFEVA